jgi:hypothetical protein
MSELETYIKEVVAAEVAKTLARSSDEKARPADRRAHVQPVSRRFLNSKEAASYLGLASADVLAVWRARGRAPPHVGTGKMIRYDVSVLDQWIATWSAKPAAPGRATPRDSI